MIREKIFKDRSPYDGLIADSATVDMQGWGSQSSVFAKLLTERRPSVIIEVGTWKGGSAIHMAKIAEENNFDTEIICVDTWLGNWQHWARDNGVGSLDDLKLKNGFPHLYYTFLNNVIYNNVDKSITPFPLPSYSAYKYFINNDIRADMIYIDGDHEYDAVFLDIKCYWRLLNDDGVLVCDDIKWPGVAQAVNELFAENLRAVHKVSGKAWFFKTDFPQLTARLERDH